MHTHIHSLHTFSQLPSPLFYFLLLSTLYYVPVTSITSYSSFTSYYSYNYNFKAYLGSIINNNIRLFPVSFLRVLAPQSTSLLPLLLFFIFACFYNFIMILSNKV
ncbi:unnamed protein product [Periconia digitata]|uniref:Uncharacterized protein n=1 Tax=Periconia digitata TaxID=1303443 RepID=A0A9W4UJQ2_9PLEO|nr:unnamed protein product [Periconia digitata]